MKRLLDDYNKLPSNSPSGCIQLCASKGYTFAGMQNARECWCGNEAPPSDRIRPESQCNAQCPGDKSKMCGGPFRMNVYATEKLWRSDGRCGKGFNNDMGTPGQCNPAASANQEGPCCSSVNWCGNSDAHCKCDGCVDYSRPTSNTMITITTTTTSTSKAATTTTTSTSTTTTSTPTTITSTSTTTTTT